MSKSERRKLLEEKMKEIGKKKKDKDLIKFGSNKIKKDTISFGIKEIDDFTGGGITKGSFSVVYGGKSVGKTTLVLHQIAEAQKQGKTCMLIDLEHGWDEERALKFGINLQELVLVETATSAEDAMDIINELAKEKLVDLIVVDSIQAMSPKGEQETKKGVTKSIEDDTMALLARKLGQFFRIVAPQIYRAQIAVMMIGQVRTAGIGSFYTYAGLSGGNALEHWMSTCLFLRHGQKADAPTEKVIKEIETPDGIHKKSEKKIVGFDCVIRMDKTKNSDSASEGDDIHLPFRFDTGFHPEIASAEGELTKKPAGENEIPSSRKEPDHISLGNEEILDKFKKKGRKKSLKNVTEEEFNALKESGLLKDIYPDAPDNFENIGE